MKLKEGTLKFLNSRWAWLVFMIVYTASMILFVNVKNVKASVGDMSIELSTGDNMAFSEVLDTIMTDVSTTKDDVNQMKTSLDFLTTKEYESYVFNITKQCIKIQLEPDDVKFVDIELALKQWDNLPDQYKSSLLAGKYNVVKEYYLENL
jgi:hypothetical protein